MSSIIPTDKTEKIYANPEDIKVVNLDSDTADEVLDALSSETTREVFVRIYDEPQTVSDVAEDTGNTIQNTKYHFEKLVDNGIIKEVGEKYSEKGNTMSIYGPTNKGIIFLADNNGDLKDKVAKSVKNFVIPIISFIVLSSFLAYMVEQYQKYTKFSRTTGSEDVSINNNGGNVAMDGTSKIDKTNTVIDFVPEFFISNPEVTVTLLTVFIGMISIFAYIASKKYLS